MKLPIEVADNILGRKHNRGVRADANYYCDKLPPRDSCVQLPPSCRIDGGWCVYQECRHSKNNPRRRLVWIYTCTQAEAEYVLKVIRQRQDQLNGVFK